MIQIKQTKDNTTPSLVLCVYGTGGIGKSTLAATAPKPIYFDAENGTKAFGIRGIHIPVIQVRTWEEIIGAWTSVANNPDYETIIMDPLGKFMDMLVEYVSHGGSMSLPKWGEAKTKFRKFINAVKDSGKHIVFVAHDDFNKNDEKLVYFPKIAVNMSDELTNLCDIVAYMKVSKGVRDIRVSPSEDYKAKDRYDVFKDGIVTEHDVTAMIKKIHAAYNAEPFGDKVPTK